MRRKSGHHDTDFGEKAKKKSPYRLMFLLVIMLAAAAIFLPPYLETRPEAVPPEVASGEPGEPDMASAGAPEPPESDIKVSYAWNYGRDHWIYDLSIPKSIIAHYRAVDRKGIKNYSYYVTDPTDDEYMSGLAGKFKEAAAAGNYSDYDMVKNIIFFVQNLNYVDDKVGTGYDEYPKFPLESLADEGGDCEDSAILLASLLRELGYGAVLLQFEDHMAVGVKGGESIPGSYFEVGGDRYYYVETTSPDWEIGEMPGQMDGQPAKILSLNDLH